MAFTPKDWLDSPSTTTPVSAAALEDLETRLAAYTDSRVGPGQVTAGGKCIVATEESRTNTAYGLMTTPDRVSGIVLPTGGLLVVAYMAQIKSSVASNGFAAIHLGANEVKAADGTTATAQSVAAQSGTSANTYKPVATYAGGLWCPPGNATAYTGHLTTGQVIASDIASRSGVCYIFAAAGTYDVTVQFKATSGSVTVGNRQLWVWVQDFS